MLILFVEFKFLSRNINFYPIHRDLIFIICQLLLHLLQKYIYCIFSQLYSLIISRFELYNSLLSSHCKYQTRFKKILLLSNFLHFRVGYGIPIHYGKLPLHVCGYCHGLKIRVFYFFIFLKHWK